MRLGLFSFAVAAAVINMSKTKSLTETCLAETGGLGVDCVIDQGGFLLSNMSGLDSQDVTD